MKEGINMIYTSYFGNIKNLSNKYYPICVARWKPKWFTGPTILSLAPSVELLRWWRASDKSEASKQKYSYIYNLQLAEKNPHHLVELLHKNCGDKIPVLLCFERPGEFCHRQLIAEWLNKNGIKCKELEKSEII